MAPNPIIIPQVPTRRSTQKDTSQLPQSNPRSLALLISTISVTVLLATAVSGLRRWLISGAGVETLLIVCGPALGTRIFPHVPTWALLSSLNLIYAVASTSWLLYAMFVAACYPFVLLTCLFQFTTVANLARGWLRKVLVGLQFTRDVVAAFNLPALNIDTDVDGLLVIRGVTLSLSNLTLVAHGVEVEIKLEEGIVLALYVDQVEVHFFRQIVIGDIYANVQGLKQEAILDDLETTSTEDDDSVFHIERPEPQATNVSPNQPRSKRPVLTKNWSTIQDTSISKSLDIVTTISPDDEANKMYTKTLEHIESTSPICEAQKQALQDRKEAPASPEDERVLRAVVCAKLQDIQAVPHAPSRSVKVTTLQNSSPPWLREFLHRLPFLLRLLLQPLGYFHPINISSINASGSGQWLTGLLQQEVFKGYAANDAAIRRLERKVMRWLAGANFCLQVSDIAGIGHVALSTELDIAAFLRFADVVAYRTAPDAGGVEQVARFGGADANVTIPNYLLPHHEHLLPPKPTTSEVAKKAEEVSEADGLPKTVQTAKEMEKLENDETEITISVHARLPACFDQSLLNFIASLVKATKVIELESAMEEADAEDPQSPTLPEDTSPDMPPPSRKGTGFKTFASGLRQNMKEGKTAVSVKELAVGIQESSKRTGLSVKELANDLHESSKRGMKRAVIDGIVNDRWIAKMVGAVAAKLEQAQGEFGYSGGIPIPLVPYRPADDLPSKLLP